MIIAMYQNIHNILTAMAHIIKGTHEVGGLTPVQVLEIIRGCRGLNIVGGDVTEVMMLAISST